MVKSCFKIVVGSYTRRFIYIDGSGSDDCINCSLGIPTNRQMQSDIILTKLCLDMSKGSGDRC